MKRVIVLVSLLCLASTSSAHDNVKNKVVGARMSAMKEMASSMKKLGAILKGKKIFDKSEVFNITQNISVVASKVPALFKEEEMDPKSKARPEIWFNYPDFVLKAKSLEQTASDLHKKISYPQDIKLAMRQIGKMCKSCHELYKN